MHIKKGDTVKILAGKDKGKTGKVIKIIPDKGRIAVEGLNVYKKHAKPKKEGEKGEIVDVTRPFNASNASPVCSQCSKPTRVGFRVEKGKKVRYCKKCDSNL